MCTCGGVRNSLNYSDDEILRYEGQTFSKILQPWKNRILKVLSTKSDYL